MHCHSQSSLKRSLSTLCKTVKNCDVPDVTPMLRSSLPGMRLVGAPCRQIYPGMYTGGIYPGMYPGGIPRRGYPGMYPGGIPRDVPGWCIYPQGCTRVVHIPLLVPPRYVQYASLLLPVLYSPVPLTVIVMHRHCVRQLFLSLCVRFGS